MKTFASILLLLLVATGGAKAVPLTQFQVSFAGTIFVETRDAKNVTHIVAQPLNAARLFKEFNLSPQNYALVTNEVGLSVNFVPISASSGLPTVQIVSLSYPNAPLIDQHLHTTLNFATVSSSATIGIFQNLTGAAFTRGMEDKTNSFPVGLAMSFTTIGTDTAHVASFVDIQFTVRTIRKFVQKP
jgi:hypothetical protein